MSARTCVVVSAFRSDEAVARLLEAAAAATAPPWEKVLVVDSLGSGAIPALIAERGWGERVEYRSYPTNLGSAGNLAKRLELAAAEGFDFAYAVNHDGVIEPGAIAALLRFADTRERARLGAVYPLRRYSRRDGKYDVTGRWRLPVPVVSTSVRPTEPFQVHWAASNGALYSLDRVREGLLPFADFWLGWEDLAHGWLMEDRGFEQWVDPAVVLDDDYEYRVHGGRMANIAVAAKPSWYTYYQVRNMLLAARRTRSGITTATAVALRVCTELFVIGLARDDKRRRVVLWVEGLTDGLRGRSGKGRLP